jgi:hypothetical protein
MKTKVLCIVLGILIGLSAPVVFADQASEIRSYIGALRRIISIMEQMQITSQQTADNTKAIKEKLGAK